MESSPRNGSEPSTSLKQVANSVWERHQALTPTQKMVCWVVLLVVLVVGCWAIFAGGDSERIYLYGGREFTLFELAAIENAFSDAGLSESQVEGLRVTFPRAEKTKYLGALSKAKIDFDTPYTYAKKAAESFNPFLLIGQRDQQSKLAKEQELALIVRNMRDVQQATVHLDEQKAGFPPTTEKTALVAVQTIGRRELPPQRIRAIRDSIAAAVAGLDRQQVTISNLETGRSYTGLDDADLNSSYAIEKMEYENYWRDKIMRLLGNVHGAHVEVNIAMKQAASASSGDASSAAIAWAPSRVTAAIDVPQSYFHKVWKSQHQSDDKKSPSPQAIAAIETATHAKIKDIVSQMLKSSAKDGAPPNVIVATWTDIPVAKIEEPTLAVVARKWATENPMLVLVISLTALGAILVRVLLGSTRRTTKPEENDARSQTAHDQQATLNLQSQLAAMVSDDPQAAAEKLNKWFKEAA